MSNASSAFLDCLNAQGPSPDRAGNMDLYGWLIGSWDLDVTRVLPDGTRRRPGEWHFGWVLEGRAIQDVWVVPPRGAGRQGDAAANTKSYGTTLRVYDARIDAWQIQWTDPVTQTYLRMVGRKHGDDIVQLGTSPDGNLIRWSFWQITAERFLWRGEVSVDKGATWRVNVEFLARRSNVIPAKAGIHDSGPSSHKAEAR
jgi:hypothetical protein